MTATKTSPCRKHQLIGPPTPKESPLGAFNPIAGQPPIADERSKVSHFEGDLICGPFNRSAIVPDGREAIL